MPVQVELDSGVMLAAEVYVPRLQYVHLLEEADWDFEYFLRDEKPLLAQPPWLSGHVIRQQ
jgi:hypothetical protein